MTRGCGGTLSAAHLLPTSFCVPSFSDSELHLLFWVPVSEATEEPKIEGIKSAKLMSYYGDKNIVVIITLKKLKLK